MTRNQEHHPTKGNWCIQWAYSQLFRDNNGGFGTTQMKSSELKSSIRKSSKNQFSMDVPTKLFTTLVSCQWNSGMMLIPTPRSRKKWSGSQYIIYVIVVYIYIYMILWHIDIIPNYLTMTFPHSSWIARNLTSNISMKLLALPNPPSKEPASRHFFFRHPATKSRG